MTKAEQNGMVGYLGHDPELFNDSVRNNILLGDDDDPEKYLKAVCFDGEVAEMEEGMDTIFEHLAPGGRLCIITFHSLEDRLVKNKFRRWATACTCPPEFPVCVCGGRAKAKLITRRPIEANTQELEENRRSRSAHLRVLEKI